MERINRSAVIPKPKQRCLEWARRDDETGTASQVFQSRLEEPGVFPRPEYEEDAQRGLPRESWPVPFDELLAGWRREPAGWPEGRTSERLQERLEGQEMSVVRSAVPRLPWTGPLTYCRRIRGSFPSRESRAAPIR